jgi:hypothetical protein
MINDGSATPLAKPLTASASLSQGAGTDRPGRIVPAFGAHAQPDFPAEPPASFHNDFEMIARTS